MLPLRHCLGGSSVFIAGGVGAGRLSSGLLVVISLRSCRIKWAICHHRYSSCNAYELLTRIPSVAEQNGSLMVGGQTLTLIINGKVTTLSGSEIVERLKATPAGRVKNAELMMSTLGQIKILR